MADGIPYDSDEGRNVAGAITALMTGRGYRKSAEVAAAVGPYDEYDEEPRAAQQRDADAPRRRLRDRRRPGSRATWSTRRSAAWDEAVELGDEHGYRNAQATVLAPTGTISFLMDCDTTGIEPDFSLVKFKELVGGGQMTIVNRTVPMALATLGYSESEVEQIEAYINDKGTIVGAPGLKDEHLPVFDVAVGERAISHMGHIQMMAAAQPFLSGAISKTVNLPETATVEDIAEAYTEGWKLGLKALAIYRDGSKTAQALRTDAGDKKRARGRGGSRGAASDRRKMPRERQSITHKFSIAGHEGYITAGKYEDGSVGEIFLTDIGKEGSTLRGMMNAFATAISIGLQYGVPLEVFVKKFSYMRFDPEGITQEPGDPVREVDARLHHALAREPVHRGPRRARGPRHPHAGGARPQGGPADADARRRARGQRRRTAATATVTPTATATASGDSVAPTAALTDTPPVVPAKMSGQRPRPGMRAVRRHDAAHGLVLHVLELRQQHRLRVGSGVASPNLSPGRGAPERGAEGTWL